MTFTTTTTILWPFSRTIRVSQCQKRTSGLYGLYIFERVMKKLKNKNEVLRRNSPVIKSVESVLRSELGRESRVGKICERWELCTLKRAHKNIQKLCPNDKMQIQTNSCLLFVSYTIKVWLIQAADRIYTQNERRKKVNGQPGSHGKWPAKWHLCKCIAYSCCRYVYRDFYLLFQPAPAVHQKAES